MDGIKKISQVIQQNPVLHSLNLERCEIHSGILLLDAVRERKHTNKIYINLTSTCFCHINDIKETVSSLNKSLPCEITVFY